MSKNLVIVESPAKASTIAKYLGKDYKVVSSIGHIRSIPKKVKGGAEPIEVDNGFRTTYEVDSDKTKVIAELKKAVKNADTVWLATDEDREGEAIAWHLCEVLKLDPKTTKRIVFHEITKPAIEAAMKNPRTIDMKLVEAQQARQILDRIVGFELSPVLWKKVPGGKSAGRVQSPAVRLLVEREREIDAFKPEVSFKVTAEFKAGHNTLLATLNERFKTEAEAEKFLSSLINNKFTVDSVETSPTKRNPGAPFTTSTLQQEANSRLNFSTKATMSAAQKLYQDGKITYMRTDSVNLSKQALAQASDYIKREYGDKYHQFRTYKTKASGAQEAHEAIRPTDMSLESASSDSYNQKLYDLIRRRALASQMAPAELEKTTITISLGDTLDNSKLKFEAKGEVIVFDGFLKVYGTSKKSDDILPAVTNGDKLDLKQAEARQTFSRPPARYTEGGLVKKLEELGIGRPSTYATIINTVQVRGYAVKGEGEGQDRDIITLKLSNSNVEREVIQEKTGADKGKLVPTASGQVVSDFLGDYFDQIIDYGFTADVEEEFDHIAAGKLDRNQMLDKFYRPFHKLIDGSGKIDRSQVAQARELGTDPKSGLPVLARLGRYGPMLQLGETTDDKDNKPRFAPLPAGAKLETVTLEEALHMFKLPRLLGQDKDGTDIKANIGRFGPYVQKDKLYASITPASGLDVFSISLDEALKLIKQKEEQKKKSLVNSFEGGIEVKIGRFGPYVTDGKVNAKVPIDLDAKDVTLAKAKELLAEKTKK